MNSKNVTTVTVVRHGQTAANVGNIIQGQSEVPLDETGLRQAELVGERLRKEPFDAIFSSDLSRAMLTARAIAGERRIQTAAELREMNLGAWQGLPVSRVMELYPDELQGFRLGRSFSVTGGETSAQFSDRVGGFLDRTVAARPGERLLFVTHAGVCREIFRHALAVTAPFPRQPVIDNASVSRYFFFPEERFYQLRVWNDVSHLTGLVFDGCGF